MFNVFMYLQVPSSDIILLAWDLTLAYYIWILLSAYRTSILLGRELNGDPRPTDVFDDNAKSPAVRMRKPIRSFPDIAREAFGQGGTIVLSFVLYFELFSCLCIFFVTLGDHLHTLFPMISITKHMIYASFGLAVPTALLRTPRLLSYLSVSAYETVSTRRQYWIKT